MKKFYLAFQFFGNETDYVRLRVVFDENVSCNCNSIFDIKKNLPFLGDSCELSIAIESERKVDIPEKIHNIVSNGLNFNGNVFCVYGDNGIEFKDVNVDYNDFLNIYSYDNVKKKFVELSKSVKHLKIVKIITSITPGPLVEKIDDTPIENFDIKRLNREDFYRIIGNTEEINNDHDLRADVISFLKKLVN